MVFSKSYAVLMFVTSIVDKITGTANTSLVYCLYSVLKERLNFSWKALGLSTGRQHGVCGPQIKNLLPGPT